MVDLLDDLVEDFAAGSAAFVDVSVAFEAVSVAFAAGSVAFVDASVEFVDALVVLVGALVVFEDVSDVFVGHVLDDHDLDTDMIERGELFEFNHRYDPFDR